jgi:hypothetical protein
MFRPVVWYKLTDVSEVLTAMLVMTEVFVPLKRLHGAIFEKTVIFILVAT